MTPPLFPLSVFSRPRPNHANFFYPHFASFHEDIVGIPRLSFSLIRPAILMRTAL